MSMTTKQAVRILETKRKQPSTDWKYAEVLTMAIEALEKEPCEDAISRQAVINAINHNCVWENEYNLTSSRIRKAVENLPPVNPKPKTGHWVRKSLNEYHCGVCDEAFSGVDFEYDYCPKCGAKMEGEE